MNLWKNINILNEEEYLRLAKISSRINYYTSVQYLRSIQSDSKVVKFLNFQNAIIPFSYDIFTKTLELISPIGDEWLNYYQKIIGDYWKKSNIIWIKGLTLDEIKKVEHIDENIREEAIIDTKKMVNLTGKKLVVVRKNISKFLSQNEAKLIKLNSENKQNAIEFLKNWEKVNSKKDPTANVSRDIKLINQIIDFKSSPTFILESNKKIIGISGYTKTYKTEEYIQTLGKTVSTMRGAGEFLIVAGARELINQGVKYINLGSGTKSIMNFKKKFDPKLNKFANLVIKWEQK